MLYLVELEELCYTQTKSCLFLSHQMSHPPPSSHLCTVSYPSISLPTRLSFPMSYSLRPSIIPYPSPASRQPASS